MIREKKQMIYRQEVGKIRKDFTDRLGNAYEISGGFEKEIRR